MSTSYEAEKSVAFEAVHAAADLCEAVRESMGHVLEKEDRTPVTVADFGSQALVCRALLSAFPEDPVIAEEDSSTLRNPDNAHIRDRVVEHVRAHVENAQPDGVYTWIDHGTAREYRDRFWTLDPIDGTKGYVRGDQYAIALALIENGIPQVAALCCPHLPSDLNAQNPTSRGQAFLAVRDEGTLQHPLHEDEAPTPIHTSDVTETSQCRFTESFVSSHSSHDLAATVGESLGITTDPIRIDSQAKYAIVASGHAEIYLRLPRPGTDYTERIWDHAAGALTVEAAGGTVTDVYGRPLDFCHGPYLKDNVGIVATCGPIHDEVVDALQTAAA